jgi:hypothetical protein
MIIINDWLEAIEDELTSGGGPLTEHEAELCTAAIKKLTPFKPEETYMLVPRCETCKHWTTFPIGREPSPFIKCQFLSDFYNIDLCTTATFGCVAWEEKA